MSAGAQGEKNARREKDPRDVPDSRPQAPAPPAPARPSREPMPVDRLERDLERLAVPKRSLFERDADAGRAALAAGPRRANPLSVLVDAVKGASGFVALIAVARVGRILSGDLAALGQTALAAAIIFVVCLGFSYAAWRARTWEFTPEGLVVRWGLANRRELTVPYEHIHTVNMSSELLERLLGLMTLNLDTGAASDEGDASKLRGLRAGEAEALRAELFCRKRSAERRADERDGVAEGEAGAGAPDRAEERPIAVFTLGGRDLMLAAASQMSAGSQALTLVIMLVNGANQLIEWGMLDVVGRGEELVAGVAPIVVPVVLAFLIVALLLGAVVSFVLNLVRYAGYRVERYADRVVVEHGLLSRSSRALASERVQYVSVRQGVIRQLIGYAEVRAVVVAAVGEEDGEPAGEVVLHPFLRIGDLDGFLAEVLPCYAGVLGRAELGRLGPVALRRAMVRAVIWWPFVAAAVGIGMWLLGLSGLAERAAWLTGPLVVAAAVLSAVLLVGLVTDALLSWRFSRYGHTDRELVLVSGGLARCGVMVSRAHVQHLAVSANPFQRRAGVASLAVRTAASRADGLALRDLPVGSADALLAWFRPRG
ncbi:PH domain-containing protein [Thermophilibacter provencensis]|uniref:PH domain-containing protein n=1 Tax=Thermophilibacter provencensis TaxID=1852386 RepID=UPI0029438EB5|nr:PH domain-containing protein [Thermophilibacter provencensis]